jgi:hypothetical protein
MSSADGLAGRASTARRWLAGVVVGAAGALLIVLGGTLGVAAFALLVVSVLARPDRRYALAGLPVGFGSVILALLLRADLACRPDECVAPDVTGWIALAVGCVLAGGLATAGMTLTARRS